MNIKRTIMVLLFWMLIFGVSTYAADCSSTECIATVKMLYVNQSDTIYVQLDATSTEESVLNCTLDSGVYFTLDMSSTPYMKNMYATLLAAAHTGHPVGLRIVDGSNGCLIQYITETF